MAGPELVPTTLLLPEIWELALPPDPLPPEHPANINTTTVAKPAAKRPRQTPFPSVHSQLVIFLPLVQELE